jgi:hypothetical protein
MDSSRPPSERRASPAILFAEPPGSFQGSQRELRQLDRGVTGDLKSHTAAGPRGRRRHPDPAPARRPPQPNRIFPPRAATPDQIRIRPGNRNRETPADHPRLLPQNRSRSSQATTRVRRRLPCPGPPHNGSGSTQAATCAVRQLTSPQRPPRTGSGSCPAIANPRDCGSPLPERLSRPAPSELTL